MNKYYFKVVKLPRAWSLFINTDCLQNRAFSDNHSTAINLIHFILINILGLLIRIPVWSVD